MVLVETVVIVVNEVPVDSVTEFSEVEPDGLGTGVLVVEPEVVSEVEPDGVSEVVPEVDADGVAEVVLEVVPE